MLTPRLNRNRIFIAALALLLGTQAVHAQASAFTYQGKLSNAGNPANGSYDIQFKVFNALTDGTQQGATLTNPTVQVTAGIFTVELDFGAGVFDGAARYLEICVRPAGSPDPYTMLAPRQPITPTPYAMRSAAAGAADGLSAACINCVTGAQVQSINGSQISGTVAGSQISGAIPAESVPTGSGNYIQNAATALSMGKNSLQQGAGFNIDGNGIIGDSLGIGIAPRAGIKLDVIGNVLISQGNGGVMQLGTPNSENGMSNIVGGGRADLRFDGTTLKLVVGPVGGPPPSTNGIVVGTSGRVSIGEVGANFGKLVVADPILNAVEGRSTDSSGIFGKSVNQYGVYGESSGGGINSYAGFFNGRTHVGNLEVTALGTAGATAVCYNSLKLLATCSSSLRYKKDLQPFGDGLSFINRLHPIAFKWKADNLPDIGFGAEDVAKINPLFVTYNDKGEVEGIKYDRLSVVFVNAFKEQQKQIEQQQIQIESLKNLICLDNPNVDICQNK